MVERAPPDLVNVHVPGHLIPANPDECYCAHIAAPVLTKMLTFTHPGPVGHFKTLTQTD